MANILVIEDDDLMRQMVCNLMEMEGNRVYGACNGKEGMNIYKKEPIDLIITDLIMPEKEGVETILELKKSKHKVKIIAISGGGYIQAEEYLEIARAFGVDYTFAKPFENKDLLNIVKELLKS